jgi:hypothetical protein
MRCIHGAMVGQRDQIDGDAAPAFAQSLWDQPCQERIGVGFECIEVTELPGQRPEDCRPRRSAFKLLAGLMHRESGGGGKDQDPHQVPAFNDAGHRQGQRIECVDRERVYILTLQGILRVCRHGGSPIGLRELASSSHYRRVPYFL